MIVVADTTPLNYLVLIQEIELLPRLFGRVLILPAVLKELQDSECPDTLKTWMANKPDWLQVQALRSEPDPGLEHLDRGEGEAIALAEELRADQLLLDETEARLEASRRNLPFIVTLGIMRRAAQLGLIDLPSTLGLLQKTTFHVRAELIHSLLVEDAAGKKSFP